MKNLPDTSLSERAGLVTSALFFLFWLVFLSLKADVFSKLDHRPTGEHVWAQIDRASVASTYHTDQAPFFLPRGHQVSETNNEGITAGEFPIIPYAVSKMYDAWGFNERYHRVFVLVLSAVGFLVLFFLAQQLLGGYLWAALVASLMLASPNLWLYSISFLPDVPSLAASILSVFFLLRQTKRPSAWNLILFAAFLALAALMKMTAVLVIGPVVVALMIAKREKGVWPISMKWLLPAVAIPAVLVLSWVLYARQLVNENGVFTFLLQPLPPQSWSQFQSGLQDFINLQTCIYVDGFGTFLVAATLLGLVFIKRSDLFLLLATVGIYFGFAVLFVVLFQKAPTHMYYWIPFQLAILFHLAWLFKLFISWNPPKWFRVAVFIGGTILINYNAIHVGKNVQQRWKYALEDVQPYYDLEAKLEALDVDYGQRIFSYSDESFNNSLYLMNRKGWTVHSHSSEEGMLRALKNCDIAVLNDTSLLSNDAYKHYFYQPLGRHNQLYVYRLHAQ